MLRLNHADQTTLCRDTATPQQETAASAASSVALVNSSDSDNVLADDKSTGPQGSLPPHAALEMPALATGPTKSGSFSVSLHTDPPDVPPASDASIRSLRRMMTTITSGGSSATNPAVALSVVTPSSRDSCPPTTNVATAAFTTLEGDTHEHTLSTHQHFMGTCTTTAGTIENASSVRKSEPSQTNQMLHCADTQTENSTNLANNSSGAGGIGNDSEVGTSGIKPTRRSPNALEIISSNELIAAARLNVSTRPVVYHAHRNGRLSTFTAARPNQEDAPQGASSSVEGMTQQRQSGRVAQAYASEHASFARSSMPPNRTRPGQSVSVGLQKPISVKANDQQLYSRNQQFPDHSSHDICAIAATEAPGSSVAKPNLTMSPRELQCTPPPLQGSNIIQPQVEGSKVYSSNTGELANGQPTSCMPGLQGHGACTGDNPAPVPIIAAGRGQNPSNAMVPGGAIATGTGPPTQLMQHNSKPENLKDHVGNSHSFEKLLCECEELPSAQSDGADLEEGNAWVLEAEELYRQRRKEKRRSQRKRNSMQRASQFYDFHTALAQTEYSNVGGYPNSLLTGRAAVPPMHTASYRDTMECGDYSDRVLDSIIFANEAPVMSVGGSGPTFISPDLRGPPQMAWNPASEILAHDDFAYPPNQYAQYTTIQSYWGRSIHNYLHLPPPLFRAGSGDVARTTQGLVTIDKPGSHPCQLETYTDTYEANPVRGQFKQTLFGLFGVRALGLSGVLPGADTAAANSMGVARLLENGCGPKQRSRSVPRNSRQTKKTLPSPTAYSEGKCADQSSECNPSPRVAAVKLPVGGGQNGSNASKLDDESRENVIPGPALDNLSVHTSPSVLEHFDARYHFDSKRLPIQLVRGKQPSAVMTDVHISHNSSSSKLHRAPRVRGDGRTQPDNHSTYLPPDPPERSYKAVSLRPDADAQQQQGDSVVSGPASISAVTLQQGISKGYPISDELWSHRSLFETGAQKPNSSSQSCECVRCYWCGMCINGCSAPDRSQHRQSSSSRSRGHTCDEPDRANAPQPAVSYCIYSLRSGVDRWDLTSGARYSDQASSQYQQRQMLLRNQGHFHPSNPHPGRASTALVSLNANSPVPPGAVQCATCMMLRNGLGGVDSVNYSQYSGCQPSAMYPTRPATLSAQSQSRICDFVPIQAGQFQTHVVGAVSQQSDTGQTQQLERHLHQDIQYQLHQLQAQLHDARRDHEFASQSHHHHHHHHHPDHDQDQQDTAKDQQSQTYQEQASFSVPFQSPYNPQTSGLQTSSVSRSSNPNPIFAPRPPAIPRVSSRSGQLRSTFITSRVPALGVALDDVHDRSPGWIGTPSNNPPTSSSAQMSASSTSNPNKANPIPRPETPPRPPAPFGHGTAQTDGAPQFGSTQRAKSSVLAQARALWPAGSTLLSATPTVSSGAPLGGVKPIVRPRAQPRKGLIFGGFSAEISSDDSDSENGAVDYKSVSTKPGGVNANGTTPASGSASGTVAASNGPDEAVESKHSSGVRAQEDAQPRHNAVSPTEAGSTAGLPGNRLQASTLTRSHSSKGLLLLSSGHYGSASHSTSSSSTARSLSLTNGLVRSNSRPEPEGDIGVLTLNPTSRKPSQERSPLPPTFEGHVLDDDYAGQPMIVPSQYSAASTSTSELESHTSGSSLDADSPSDSFEAYTSQALSRHCEAYNGHLQNLSSGPMPPAFEQKRDLERVHRPPQMACNHPDNEEASTEHLLSYTTETWSQIWKSVRQQLKASRWRNCVEKIVMKSPFRNIFLKLSAPADAEVSGQASDARNHDPNDLTKSELRPALKDFSQSFYDNCRDILLGLELPKDNQGHPDTLRQTANASTCECSMPSNSARSPSSDGSSVLSTSTLNKLFAYKEKFVTTLADHISNTLSAWDAGLVNPASQFFDTTKNVLGGRRLLKVITRQIAILREIDADQPTAQGDHVHSHSGSHEANASVVGLATGPSVVSRHLSTYPISTTSPSAANEDTTIRLSQDPASGSRTPQPTIQLESDRLSRTIVEGASASSDHMQSLNRGGVGLAIDPSSTQSDSTRGGTSQPNSNGPAHLSTDSRTSASLVNTWLQPRASPILRPAPLVVSPSLARVPRPDYLYLSVTPSPPTTPVPATPTEGPSAGHHQTSEGQLQLNESQRNLISQSVSSSVHIQSQNHALHAIPQYQQHQGPPSVQVQPAQAQNLLQSQSSNTDSQTQIRGIDSSQHYDHHLPLMLRYGQIQSSQSQSVSSVPLSPSQNNSSATSTNANHRRGQQLKVSDLLRAIASDDQSGSNAFNMSQFGNGAGFSALNGSVSARFGYSPNASQFQTPYYHRKQTGRKVLPVHGMGVLLEEDWLTDSSTVPSPTPETKFNSNNTLQSSSVGPTQESKHSTPDTANAASLHQHPEESDPESFVSDRAQAFACPGVPRNSALPRPESPEKPMEPGSGISNDHCKPDIKTSNTTAATCALTSITSGPPSPPSTLRSSPYVDTVTGGPASFANLLSLSILHTQHDEIAHLVAPQRHRRFVRPPAVPGLGVTFDEEDEEENDADVEDATSDGERDHESAGVGEGCGANEQHQQHREHELHFQFTDEGGRTHAHASTTYDELDGAVDSVVAMARYGFLFASDNPMLTAPNLLGGEGRGGGSRGGSTAGMSPASFTNSMSSIHPAASAASTRSLISTPNSLSLLAYGNESQTEDQ